MKRLAVVATLIGVLLLGLVVSARVGQLPVSTTDVLGATLARLGIASDWMPSDEVIAMTLEQIRFPRVALSALVGAALAVGGAVMQAIFGNPLAEPGVVGVSSGAALGAAAAIVSGISVAGGASVAVAAFVSGFVATVLVYVTARANGRTEVVTLLLTGIAVNAFAGAGIALVMFMGDTASREQIVFWQLGSLNGARWQEVAVVAVIVVPTTLIALALARRYDLLSLGERSASHLGVRVEALRIGSIALVALLTAAAVAFAGIISFVGLVVPHSMRMLLGPSHRGLLVASVIAGAALLVWCDLLARTAVAGADLPIGMITALIGGPFFFVLIRQARSRAGGWG
ncbi:iron ABC transporter permease [Aeromicrobium phragmitis]|uniref:Iron ABC transporter permease n=1 Tax=Aeromicrobium phragmitis TaxID=2478914 RepID=A0A3L8PHK1_9ACTN|nr:iron ABC transporter permease [Aeromicrobium phragmitis]RLV54725.1 iron ABC transporter permease [Aeromicrobium phragmitis]